MNVGHSLLLSLAFCALLMAPGQAQGYFPLHRAAERGDVVALSQLLQEAPQTIDTEDDEGETALMEAAEEGNVEAVRLLLDRGASINHQDRDGETALMEAAEEGKIDVVELLLRAGAALGYLDKNEETALQRSKDEKIRKLLKARGARN